MAVFASDQWNDRLAAWRASPAKAYGSAVGLVALATGLRAATAPVTGPCDPFTAYFPAVALAAVLGGRNGAMLAVLLAALAGRHLPFAGSDYWTARHPDTALLLFLAAASLVAAIPLLLTAAMDRRTARHERRRARHRLLVEELHHRTRNLFGMVDLMAARSFAKGPELEAYRGRLRVLADSYGLALTAPEGMALDALLRRQLAAYEGQVTLHGCEVMLNRPSCQHFALIVHELLTNAVKHGALSTAKGRVIVSGTSIAQPDGTMFVFVWQESEGPAVSPPRRVGFGSVLLQQAPRLLGAESKLEYRPEGLRYIHRCPLQDITRGRETATG
jgi:two-component sensor histidine kinase